MGISQYEMILRLLLGAVIGGIIGYERQVHGRPAGFRTHILVCVACVLLMNASGYYHSLGVSEPAYLRADPGRIAAGAITGVGFIGAGVVLRTGFSIQGLTTAATIWMVSAIGLAVGEGLYLAGIVTTGITMFSLVVLRRIESRMPKLYSRVLTIVAGETVEEDDIIAVLTKHDVHISNVDYEQCSISETTTYNYAVSFYNKKLIKSILGELSSLADVKRVCVKS
jgi:putative Mg2+ transporter-C (MgtC) family protein